MRQIFPFFWVPRPSWANLIDDGPQVGRPIFGVLDSGNQ